MSFGKNLRKLLADRNLKQADLCRLTGIQTSLVSDYLGEKKSPTIGNAILIADALHLSLDTLVGRDASPAPLSPVSAKLCRIASGLAINEQELLLDIATAMKKRLEHDSLSTLSK